MLQRAVAAAKETESTQIVGVTVLTSLDASDLEAVGVSASPSDQALRLATMAWDAGVRAFVCSPKEVARLRAALGPDATFITPGIRPAGAETQDQKRVATPGSAIADGADILVVGRPIRDAASPVLAAKALVAEIERALADRSPS
jgi:orotidine-5'-phosphate decarboxylase